ncbi:hypothetical protein GQ44DRAFT_594906, partial [Phaeosphaeriaceae sp. PMI808]
NLPEASRIQGMVVTQLELRYGPRDVKTLNAIHDLATISKSQGNFEDARREYNTRAITLLEGVVRRSQDRLGPENVVTLTSMEKLGMLYVQSGKLPQAIGLRKIVLKHQMKVLGDMHVNTHHTMLLLGVELLNSGDLYEAEQVLTRCLKLRALITG